MEALLESLVRSPKLNLYLDQLQHVAADEAARRARFYDELRDAEKVEFINGEVIVHSPDLARHTATRKRLMRLVGTYVDLHHLGWIGDEKALTVFTRNDYMPDTVFFGPEKAAAITGATLKFPVPDFAVEVLSPGTERRDRGVKREDFAAHAVGEYWIVDPEEEALEIHLPDGAGGYRLEARQHDGTARATVLAGLVLPVRAVFDDEENLRALRQLIG
ncbi:MAG: hypothetical protein QOE70_762 [Chthoniobacter sp.]|jgi:Uma2 family endonuclease|nr:hypothetical protein [Chthoniobacter sp.]